MKRNSWLILPALFIGLAACQADSNEPAGTAADTTTVQSDLAVTNSIDRQLQDVDEDLNDLETRLQSAPAEVREEVDMDDLREERREIDSLKSNLATINDPEQRRERASDLWDEVRDLDVAVTEARFEAADEQAEFQEVGRQEMQELDDEIAALEADSANVAPELREERRQRLAELRDEREDLRASWEKVEGATESTWQSAKEEVVQGWNKFKKSLYSIRLPDIDIEANRTEDGNSGAS